MAYASAALPAAELALRALDKPLLIGRNWMRTTAIVTRWSVGGTWATADTTDASGDRAYAYDEWDHLRTFPNAAQTDWYFLIDFASGIAEIDSLLLINPYGLSGVRIRAQIADNNAYDSNLVTVCDVTPSTAARVVQLSLDHTATNPRRYTSVRWMRLWFFDAATCTPKFGELVVGRCRQLPYKPAPPYDKNHLRTHQEIEKTDSCVYSSHVFAKKQRVLSASFTLDSSTDSAALETFWETEIDGGTLPYVWIDDPTTTPANANWMREMEPEFSGPIRVGNVRDFELRSEEQGPNFLKLGV